MSDTQGLPDLVRSPVIFQLRASEHVLDFDHTKDISLVADSTLNQLSACGVHILYLLGAWSTGLHAVDYSATHFPHLPRTSLAASPFSITAYDVPACLGGDGAVRSLRSRCHARGMRLLLDFVPNHVAVDHPWASQRPELLLRCESATPDGALPAQCVRVGETHFAHGAERAAPSGAWGDTLQLDYRRAATRAAMRDVVFSIVRRGLADGLRCDMAHLVLRERFERAWAMVPPPASPPVASKSGTGEQTEEFWGDVISAARAVDAGFVFLAESYGGEAAWQLQQLGFNFTYDDSFYHKARGAAATPLQQDASHCSSTASEAGEGQLVWPAAARGGLQPQSDASALSQHMAGAAVFHSRCCRYIENHDEPRAAAAFALPVAAVGGVGGGATGGDSAWRDAAAATLSAEQARHFAAAVLLMFSPGARLLHDGQLSGRRLHHSMHVSARPSEEAAPWAPPAAQLHDDVASEVQWPYHGVASFYSRLLQLSTGSTCSSGLWAPVPVLQEGAADGKPAVSSALLALVRVPRCSAVTSSAAVDEACLVVVVNMTHKASGGALALASVGTGEAGAEEAAVGDAVRCMQHVPQGVATFTDRWSGNVFRRSAAVFSAGQGGLPVHLPPWGFHIFSVTAPASGSQAVVTCAVAQGASAGSGDGAAEHKALLLPMREAQPPAATWRI